MWAMADTRCPHLCRWRIIVGYIDQLLGKSSDDDMGCRSLLDVMKISVGSNQQGPFRDRRNMGRRGGILKSGDFLLLEGIANDISTLIPYIDYNKDIGHSHLSVSAA